MLSEISRRGRILQVKQCLFCERSRQRVKGEWIDGLFTGLICEKRWQRAPLYSLWLVSLSLCLSLSPPPSSVKHISSDISQVWGFYTLYSCCQSFTLYMCTSRQCTLWTWPVCLLQWCDCWLYEEGIIVARDREAPEGYDFGLSVNTFAVASYREPAEMEMMPPTKMLGPLTIAK